MNKYNGSYVYNLLYNISLELVLVIPSDLVIVDSEQDASVQILPTVWKYGVEVRV